jgi:hypothetical protein
MELVMLVLQIIGYIALALVIVWLLGDFFGKGDE